MVLFSVKSVLTDYLAYKIIVDVRATQNLLTNLPSFTLWRQIKNSLNYSHICQHYPDTCAGNDSEKTVLNFLSKDIYSYKDVLNSLVNVNHFISSCFVNLETSINCTHTSNLAVGLNMEGVYYTILGQNSSMTRKLTYNIPLAPKYKYLLDMTFHRNKARESIQLLIHSPKLYQDAESLEPRTIWLSAKTQFTIHYRKYQVQLLPAPYQTNCEYYANNTNYTSKFGCFASCFHQKVIGYCGHLTSMVVVHNDLHEIKRAIGSKCHQEMYVSWYHICNRHCEKPNCEEDFYEITSAAVSRQLDNGTRLVIDYPGGSPVITFAYRPRLRWMDVLLYLGGTLGTCAGLSFLDIIKILRKCIYGNNNSSNQLPHVIFLFIQKEVQSKFCLFKIQKAKSL